MINSLNVDYVAGLDNDGRSISGEDIYALLYGPNAQSPGLANTNMAEAQRIYDQLTAARTRQVGEMPTPWAQQRPQIGVGGDYHQLLDGVTSATPDQKVSTEDVRSALGSPNIPNDLAHTLTMLLYATDESANLYSTLAELTPGEVSALSGLMQRFDSLPDEAKTEVAKAIQEHGGDIRVTATLDALLSSPSFQGADESEQIEQVKKSVARLSVDFSLIGADRQAGLSSMAEGLIAEYAPPGRNLSKVDFNDLGSMINDLDEAETSEVLQGIATDLSLNIELTDMEKAFVWSEIVDAKGRGGTFGYRDADLRISNNGVNPDLKDSHWFAGRGWNTPSHTAVPFHDAIHGFGAHPSTGNFGGYAYDSLERATERITAAEGWHGIQPPNPGDRRASIASTKAFHAWRDAPIGERFSAFATTWQQEILR